MGFDGIPRTSQLLPNMDALSASQAVSAAGLSSAKRRQSNPLKQMKKGDFKKQGSSHPLEAIKSALVEGLEQPPEESTFLTLADDHEYHFVFDADRDRIHLVDLDTQKVILSLTPQEFHAVAEKLMNPAGTMTDRHV